MHSGRTACNDVGGSNSDGGSVSGEGAFHSRPWARLATGSMHSGRTACNDVGGSNSDGGSVSGEGAMGFLGPGRLRAGGSAMTPSRCMRSSATRALMSLSPPSGLRQWRRSHTTRDSAARFNGGSCSAMNCPGFPGGSKP